MLRYLNMFILIGIALIGISLIGFATHNQFLTEPGQKPNATASLIYLGAGVLMLINGVVSIRTAPVAPARPTPPDSNQKPEGDDGNGESLVSAPLLHE